MNRLTVLALAVLLFAAGCVTSGRQLSRLASAAVPGSELRAYCVQAREQGWCSPDCYRRLPAQCSGAGMTLISCNAEGMCSWWSGTSLVYGYSAAAASASSAPYAIGVRLNWRQRATIRAAYAWYGFRDWLRGER